MKEINHIMACLDLTNIDPHLIQYAAYVAAVFEAEKVCFLHAIQAYDLPERRRKAFAEVKASLDRKIREELDQLIGLDFRKHHDIEVEIRIEEEDAADGILKCIEERGIDLTLLGQKLGEDRKGFYGKKIASQAPCDILFVPENSEPEIIEKALCAIDFSETSETAFQVALYLSENRQVDILCYYIQDPSRAYFPASTVKSASRKQNRSEQNYQELLKKYNVEEADFPCRIEAGDSMTSEPEKIYRLAEEEEMQLIIVGARGDTANETSLLGNITETLRRMQTEIPIIIVKDGDQKSILDFFRSGEA